MLYTSRWLFFILASMLLVSCPLYHDMIPPEVGTPPEHLVELNFPSLKIPPPPTRKQMEYPIDFIFPNARTYGDVDVSLCELLGKAGFGPTDDDQSHYSYFQINNLGQFSGFSVVTDFEQTTEKGIPLEKRFDLAVNRAEYTSILKRLLLAPLGKGYYRLFAFLVTDDYYGQPGKPLSRSIMQESLGAGARELHPAISTTQLTPRARLHVLVYEYEQLESDTDGRPIDLAGMNAKKHLRAAGLNDLIK